MKRFAWFALGFLCCGLVVFGLKAIMPLTPTTMAQQSSDAGENEFDAEGLFRTGLAVTAKDVSRGDYLTQMALRRQSDQPLVVGLIWKRFRDYLDSQKLPPSDRLARLTIYRDSVEATLMACRKREEFEQVWGVRQKVLDSMREAQGALQNEVVREVTAFQEKSARQSPLPALQAFAQLRVDLEPRLAVLLTTQEEDAPRKGQALFKPAVDLVTGAVEEGKRISQQVDALADQGVKEGKVDAAKDGTPGPCERLLQDLQDFSVALEQAQLTRWLLLTKDDAAQAKLDTLNRDLARLHGKLAKSQQLRYNLWAVRQIYSAETANNWDANLGNIDVGLLHPTTAALYSSTYDSRIRKVDDPLARIRTVQLILNRKRVPLSAF